VNQVIVNETAPIALIGGAQLAPEHLNILQTLTDTFVAADSGADHLLENGIIPRRVVGDLDSISAKARDTTDLEKALNQCRAPVIIGAGFLGGRIDHSFASFSALAKNAAVPLILLSNEECCFRCPDAGAQLDLPGEMDALPLQPAGFVSSSNETKAREVMISVTGPAIITVPLAHLSAAIDVVRAG